MLRGLPSSPVTPAGRRATSRASRRAQRRRRARKRLLLVGGACIVLVAGATAAWAVTRDDGTDGSAAATTSTTSTSTTVPLAPTTPTTTRDPIRGNGQAVTFAFGGDVMFEGALRAKLLEDPNGLLASVAPVLSAADVAVVNLETAVTDGGEAVQPKKYNFRAPPVALDALKAAGIDAVSLANNHGLDFGLEGLTDTLAAGAERQYPVIGIGNNAAEALTPYRVDIRGQRISVFGVTDVIDSPYEYDWRATDTAPGVASSKFEGLDRLVETIKQWRPESETIVVYLHWGIEREPCPSDRQREVARALTDAGADIIVGTHAHWVQGAGMFDRAFVGYGLGNFVFYNEQGEYGRSGVLQVTATGRTIDGYQWVPARILDGVATPLPPGADADAELAHWNELRGCTGLEA
jgi:poly-gamma-glutamate capsule biosynthesis protein CapA/YwtB (metallophosphatase superfamily)